MFIGRWPLIVQTEEQSHQMFGNYCMLQHTIFCVGLYEQYYC